MNSDRAKTFKAGDLIFKEGDPSQSMYIVRSGKVCIKRANESYVVSVGPDEFFGEMGLFEDLPRSASAVADQDTELYEITRQDFDLQINRLPGWAKKFFIILSKRIRETNDRVRFELFDDHLVRLIQLFEMLANTYGKAESTGVSLAAELVQVKSKLLLNISPGMLEDLLVKVEEQGYIQRNGPVVRIPNVNYLEKYSAYMYQKFVLRNRIGDVEKYGGYPPKLITISEYLWEAIESGKISAESSSIGFDATQLKRYMPEKSGIETDDMFLAAEKGLLDKEEEKDIFKINVDELENVRLFEESESRLKELLTKQYRTFLKAIQVYDKLNKMELNSEFQELFDHPMSRLDTAFFKKLKVIEPSKTDPDYWTIQPDEIKSILEFVLTSREIEQVE